MRKKYFSSILVLSFIFSVFLHGAILIGIWRASQERSHSVCRAPAWPVHRRGTLLPVPAQKQRCGNWCWAAASSMLLGYYGQDIPQCRIVSYQMKRDCCIADPCADPFCNLPISNKDIPLLLMDYGVEAELHVGALNDEELAHELRLRRPVMIGLFHPLTENGHLLLLTGSLPPATRERDILYYAINPDPDECDMLVPYADLLIPMDLQGVWVTTIRTFPDTPPSP